MYFKQIIKFHVNFVQYWFSLWLDAKYEPGHYLNHVQPIPRGPVSSLGYNDLIH